MASNTSASMDKLTWADYVDFQKHQVRIRQFSWSEKDSNCLDVELNIFKKDKNKDFRLVQTLTMGESDFNQFNPMRKQLVIVAENFGSHHSFSPYTDNNTFQRLDEQLKLSQKVVDVVDRP